MEQLKPWYLSNTIWGIIIAFIGFIAKQFFSIYVPDFSSELIQIIGLCMALIGRLRATSIIS